ncbi:hypothetical protein B0W96_10105 [Mycobacterium tuberculosis]|nr:hypothetical protein B0W96_10105 [Mycobacterium tuberculosis]
MTSGSLTPGVDGQSQVGKSGAQIGPPDQVVAWADVRSLTANSLSNYAVNRPGMSGDSSSWKGWGHVRWFIEEVPAGAA